VLAARAELTTAIPEPEKGTPWPCGPRRPARGDDQRRTCRCL